MKRKLTIGIILILVINCLGLFGDLSYARDTANVEGFSKISTGMNLTMAIKNDGTLWAWGNHYDDHGDGSNTPFQIKGLADVKAVSARWDNAVVLKNDGTVWAFTIDFHHGEATTNLKTAPVQIKELTDVAAVSAGMYRTLALKKDGTVWEWGIYSTSGYTKYGSPVPIQVKGLKDVISISSGYSHSVAVEKDGTVLEWGYEDEGIVNEGYTKYSETPVKIEKLTNTASISTGGAGGSMVRMCIHSLALKKDGTVWRVVENEFDHPYGTDDENKSFAQIKGLNDVVSISAGGGLGIALKKDGTVWEIYDKYDGDNGVFSEINVVSQVKGLEDIVEISAGYSHAAALRKDGTVFAWGSNDAGQLGNGTNNDSETVVQSLINLGTQPSRQVETQPSDNQSNSAESTGAATIKKENVENPLKINKLILSNNSIKLKIGKTASIKAYAVYTNGTKVEVTKKITWTWSSSNIASYKDGIIKAKSIGSCSATANYSGAKCKLSVVVTK